MSLQGFYCGTVSDDTSGFVVMRIVAHVYCTHMSFVEGGDDVAGQLMFAVPCPSAGNRAELLEAQKEAQETCASHSCARQYDESCYIQVLISEGTNAARTAALENCESRDINTLTSILTGFKETSYLSIIIPEISGSVSCWDLEDLTS